MIYQRRIGQSTGVMHLNRLSFLGMHDIGNVGHRSDHVHIELTIETFLHNLHVQQSQEAATETETQCRRALWLERQRGIVQLQLLQRGTQVLEIFAIYRINTCEYHRFHLLKTSDTLRSRTSHMGNRIAHSYLPGSLDTRDDVPHIACTDLVSGRHGQLQHTYLIRIILLLCRNELHPISLMNHPILYLKVSNDATERIEHRVENQALQRGLWISFRRRHLLHNGIQDLHHTFARLSTRTQDILSWTTQQLHNLVFHLIRHRTRQINLIHHRNDLQIILDSHIEVGDRLRLNALCSIHDQQSTLTSRNRARYLIREIDMSRGINQV